MFSGLLFIFLEENKMFLFILNQHVSQLDYGQLLLLGLLRDKGKDIHIPSSWKRVGHGRFALCAVWQSQMLLIACLLFLESCQSPLQFP